MVVWCVASMLCEQFVHCLCGHKSILTSLKTRLKKRGDGIFECPAWMRVLIRETNDPFTLAETGRTGGVNIIDLANINSCSFIATQDLGKLYANHQFEILGRFDDAALRGCNLLVD